MIPYMYTITTWRMCWPTSVDNLNMYILTRSHERRDQQRDNISTFSFLEAFRRMKSGLISWDEYIRHLLARTTGVEHEDDDVDGVYLKLLNTDPFGYSIWCFSNEVGNVKGERESQPDSATWLTSTLLADATPFIEVFDAYRHGSLEDVKAKIVALSDEHAKRIRNSLSLLALQERRAEVLKFCLDEGDLPFEACLRDEANRVDETRDPETFGVLESSHFRQIYPRRVKNSAGAGDRGEDQDEEGHSDEMGDEEDDLEDVAAAFDEGGSHPVYW